MSYLDAIPESDREVYGRGRYGSKMGFGLRPAIVVIDMMNNAFDPKHTRSISKDMGTKALKSIRSLIDEARHGSIPIVYSKSGRETGLLFDLGVSRKAGERAKKEGFKPKDPSAYEIVKELAPAEGDLIITKIRASIFFCTPLISYLIYNNIDTLIMTGQSTSGCVRASVVDAASYNFRVIIPEECVADRAVVPHKVNLFDMAMKYADVIPLSEVLDYLRNLS